MESILNLLSTKHPLALKHGATVVTETEIGKQEAGLPEELTTSTSFPKKNVGIAPTPTTNKADEVRVLTLADYEDAAYSLALAFWDDHSSRYFIHTPDRAHWTLKQKWDLHLKMMGYIVYAHLLKGLVVSAGEGYGCVALWMPPAQNMDDPLTLLRSGLWRLTYQLSPEGRTRFFTEFLPLLNHTKSSVLGPHKDTHSYYLVYIGTRPRARGNGFARKCIDAVTARADREGRACYLESSNDVNRGIYGRMGFVLQREIFLQRGGGEEGHVRLDIMVREPVGEEGEEGDADSGVDV
ncbi:hypothetical protein DOTSEDRAFT_74255 [Lecanosticta acicola]|uniref:N-acetyltransferase domain-containing protein n=1 Tax=Lecanosticta acicola TaxID=111012 RepID=A0AAI8Z0Z5_9PEZI|nr:hypothetical protein DOTSEDRAFT_74255 [Lecanosticta acicola]